MLTSEARRPQRAESVPDMVDWMLARALSGGAPAAPVRERLAVDILASINEDHSFGRYDVPMSTALAILALTSLGIKSDCLLRTRLRLADLIRPDGRCPAGIPFYSTAVVAQDRFPAGTLTRLMLGERPGQFAWVEGQVHAVSLYLDEHHMIATSLTMLALPGNPVASLTTPPIKKRGSCHQRYRCTDHMEYIAGYAVPPYVA